MSLLRFVTFVIENRVEFVRVLREMLATSCRAVTLGIKRHRAATEGNVDRYVSRFDERGGSRSGQKLPVLGGGFIRVGRNHRLGLDQFVNHEGRFRWPRRKRIADIHHDQIGAIQVSDHGFLFGGDAGIS